jgi:hypothetical protein
MSRFSRTRPTLESPASLPFAITPSDTTNFAEAARAIYVGSAGNVAVVPIEGGTAVTFVGAVAGSILPVRAIRVNSTGTTAGSLVGLI